MFGGWVLFMVAWGLTGQRAKPGVAVGGAPFWQYAPLAQDEHVLGEMRAVWHASPRVARQGMLYFTNRRMIFVPRRYPRAPKVHELRLDDIVDWRFEQRRRLGLGAVVPFARPALIVTTIDGREHVLWAVPGYDIVNEASAALPAPSRESD